MQFCVKCAREYPPEYKLCPVHGVALSIEPGDVIREKYRVVREIGTGAMGQVFEVEDLDFHKGRNRSAMKVPLGPYAADAAFVQRFRAEAAKQRSVDHPNVVRIEHVDKTDAGTPFLLMELVEGQSLRWWMSREPRLKWQHCVRIAREVALALKAALAVNLVHCDIKPENIFSTTKLSPLPLKVMDFGLAKETSVLAAAAGSPARGTVWGGETVAGTPEYMSPEQTIRRASVQPASDIYSLGVVLFEMLAGKLPYAGIDSVEAARKAHAEEKPATLNDCPGLPAGLPQLVARMLSIKPEDRPTVDEVIAGLESFEVPEASIATSGTNPSANPPVSVPRQTDSGVAKASSEVPPNVAPSHVAPSDVAPPPVARGRGKIALVLAGIAVLGAAAIAFGVLNKPSAPPPVAQSGGGGSGTAPVPVAPPPATPPPTIAQAPSDQGFTPPPEPAKPALSTITVTCDLDCVVKVDKKNLGTLTAGRPTTLKLPLMGGGGYVLDAATLDDRDHEPLKITSAKQTAEFRLAGIRDTRLKKISDLVAQGNASLHANQYQEAITHFEDALRFDPDNKDAKMGRDQALRECSVFGSCHAGSKP